MLIRVNVNGEWQEADVWPGASLLFALREDFGLRGSKNACEQGECGSCSVWLDGELVCACLVLASQAHEREVRTVESLSGPGEDLGCQSGVSLSLRRATHGPGRNGSIATEGEFGREQPVHAFCIHHQHEGIGLRAADLEPEASALHPDGAGSRPAYSA